MRGVRVVAVVIIVRDDLQKLKRGCELASKDASEMDSHDEGYFGSENVESK
jgi:hypothetical protein